MKPLTFGRACHEIGDWLPGLLDPVPTPAHQDTATFPSLGHFLGHRGTMLGKLGTVDSDLRDANVQFYKDNKTGKVCSTAL